MASKLIPDDLNVCAGNVVTGGPERIVGGEIIEEHSWSWMAMVLFNGSQGTDTIKQHQNIFESQLLNKTIRGLGFHP